jgi:hypothetical protein
MTDTLADHIRDAHDNLKAGIERLKVLQASMSVTHFNIPGELNRAAHALSYAAKAVETQPSVDAVRQTVANEWGSWVCYQDADFSKRTCDQDKSCRCADIARAVISQHTLVVPQAADAKAEPLREDLRAAIMVAIADNVTVNFEPLFDGVIPLYETGQRAMLQKLEGIGKAADAILALAPPAVDRAAVIEELRPMDTAPKNGTEVLLQVRYRANVPGKFLVGHYMPGGHCISDHPPIDSGWYFWNGCMFDKAAEPVAWAPLPRALADAKGDGTAGE